jgi:hypothetical protein
MDQRKYNFKVDFGEDQYVSITKEGPTYRSAFNQLNQDMKLVGGVLTPNLFVPMHNINSIEINRETV